MFHSGCVEKASRDVNKLYESSELQELWEESEDYSQWQAAIHNLLDRLQPA